MVAQINAASKYQVVALPFSATNIGNANGTFVSVEPTTFYYTLPAAGAVVGASVLFNSPLTSGTFGLSVILDGTVLNGTFARLEGNGALLQANERWDASRNGYRFAAGETIGVMWKKEGTIAPTTTDATVMLLVLLEGLDF